MAAGLVVAGCPVNAGALVPAAGTFAPLAPAPRPVLGAWCELAGAVGAGAAAGGELGVEDVECVGGDLGDVDVVEGSQVAGDDPAALLERVRRPPALLDRDPLGGEVAEGAPRVGPRLARGDPPPRQWPGVGRPACRWRRPSSWPSAWRRSAGRGLCGRGAATGRRGAVGRSPSLRQSTACHRWMARWMARRKSEEALGDCEGLLTSHFMWHPQRDSNPCRQLERAVIGPHGVLSSPCALVSDLLLRTEPAETHAVPRRRWDSGWVAATAPVAARCAAMRR